MSILKPSKRWIEPIPETSGQVQQAVWGRVQAGVSLRSLLCIGEAMKNLLWMLTTLIFLITPCTGSIQDLDSASWAVEVSNRYRIIPNVTYLIADGYKSKLDIMVPRIVEKPVPTLIYIHGGGWVSGTKEGSVLRTLPYLEMGWAVVNIEYRLARTALAPAAVEDCRCALSWVIQNSEKFGFDPNRIVLTGGSAGGHLSLMTGMLPVSAGLDRRCPVRKRDVHSQAALQEAEMRVAAIINWYGITDVADLLIGNNAKTYAVAWMGSMPDRFKIAKRVSPLTWVREDLPPVLTIHGDADLIVPYDQAIRLHRALDKVGVPNELYTVKSGEHGGFSLDEIQRAFAAIREFLARHVGLNRGHP